MFEISIKFWAIQTFKKQKNLQKIFKIFLFYPLLFLLCYGKKMKKKNRYFLAIGVSPSLF